MERGKGAVRREQHTGGGCVYDDSIGTCFPPGVAVAGQVSRWETDFRREEKEVSMSQGRGTSIWRSARRRRIRRLVQVIGNQFGRAQ